MDPATQHDTDVHRKVLRARTRLNRVSDLRVLAIPPGNRLERLVGSRRGQHSIRIH